MAVSTVCATACTTGNISLKEGTVMTDVDGSTGTLVDYFVMFVFFWTAFIAFFLLFVRYVWPVVEHLYWKTAAKSYWFLREFCRRDGYDGYAAHINRKGWMK
jgi:hypothetical protein